MNFLKAINKNSLLAVALFRSLLLFNYICTVVFVKRISVNAEIEEFRLSFNLFLYILLIFPHKDTGQTIFKLNYFRICYTSIEYTLFLLSFFFLLSVTKEIVIRQITRLLLVSYRPIETRVKLVRIAFRIS